MSEKSTFMKDATGPVTAATISTKPNRDVRQIPLIAEDANIVRILSDGLQRVDGIVGAESSSGKVTKRKSSLGKDAKKRSESKLVTGKKVVAKSQRNDTILSKDEKKSAVRKLKTAAGKELQAKKPSKSKEAKDPNEIALISEDAMDVQEISGGPILAEDAVVAESSSAKTAENKPLITKGAKRSESKSSTEKKVVASSQRKDSVLVKDEKIPAVRKLKTADGKDREAKSTSESEEANDPNEDALIPDDAMDVQELSGEPVLDEDALVAESTSAKMTKYKPLISKGAKRSESKSSTGKKVIASSQRKDTVLGKDMKKAVKITKDKPVVINVANQRSKSKSSIGKKAVDRSQKKMDILSKNKKTVKTTKDKPSISRVAKKRSESKASTGKKVVDKSQKKDKKNAVKTTKDKPMVSKVSKKRSESKTPTGKKVVDKSQRKKGILSKDKKKAIVRRLITVVGQKRKERSPSRSQNKRKAVGRKV